MTSIQMPSESRLGSGVQGAAAEQDEAHLCMLIPIGGLLDVVQVIPADKINEDQCQCCCHSWQPVSRWDAIL